MKSSGLLASMSYSRKTSVSNSQYLWMKIF